MSRHNRRRTRCGRKALISCQHGAFELPSSAESSEPKIPDARDPRRSDLSWHNRFLTGQARGKKPKEERERLKEERKRIFGGDGTAGEDDGLCLKMMDYFARLDYL